MAQHHFTEPVGRGGVWGAGMRVPDRQPKPKQLTSAFMLSTNDRTLSQLTITLHYTILYYSLLSYTLLYSTLLNSTLLFSTIRYRLGLRASGLEGLGRS